MTREFDKMKHQSDSVEFVIDSIELKITLSQVAINQQNHFSEQILIMV